MINIQEISQAIILAIVQGLTEFLPVSSSAHLILFPKLLGWSDQGLAFDVAIHFGTLCAVLIYFRQQIKDIICKEHKLGWSIVFGTIPVGITGLLGHDFIAHNLRATWVIAASTIVFGLVLGIAAFTAKQKRNEHNLTWSDVIFIGCAQALALIPGVSRSGITLSAGLFAGLTRTAAARFSFLLSIPVILLATGLESYKLVRHAAQVNWLNLSLGFTVAAITGYLCIDIFLRLIQRYGVMPFVIYRLVLGVIILFVVFPSGS